MATWTNISASTWKIDYNDAAGTNMDGNVRLTLQYDSDSETPTSVKIRFKLDRTDTSSHYYDSMYVLYNANNDPSGRTLLKIKDYQDWTKAAWPYYTSSITLSKTYSAAEFRVQDVWVCNNGNTAVTVSADNFAKVFASDGSRKNYAHRQSASTLIAISSSTTVATAGGAPSGLTITDNGNNTYTITGKQGTNGTNNAITGSALYYTTNGNNPDNSITTSKDGTTRVALTTKSGGSYTRGPLSISAKTTVKATCNTSYTHGSFKSQGPISKTVKYYAAPGDVGKPALAASSFKNSRLTIKQNWTYTWTAATAANTDSGVVGYRIRMYKNGSLVKGIKAGTGSNITKGTGTNEYLDREGSTNCSITFDPGPSGFDFKAGDTIYITVFAWAKNGAGTVLWSGGGNKAVASATSTVQNSGVVRVCTSTTGTKFVEGIVHICKEAGKWTEADIVKVCTSTTGTKWSESE